MLPAPEKCKCLTVVVFVIALLALPACSSEPYIVEYQDDGTATEMVDVYVVDHGWHTGFVIPSEKIKSLLPMLKERFPDVPYMEIGWGDKGFYQTEEITTGLTISAIFWPTDTVVHTVGVPVESEEFFTKSTVLKLPISTGGFSSLMTFISGSFRKDDTGEIVELKKGIYGDSQFYEGVGNYYLMNTCNKWTAKGLRSSGLDISTVFKLTADSVMDCVKEHQ